MAHCNNIFNFSYSGPKLKNLDVPYYTRAWIAEHGTSDYVLSPKKKNKDGEIPYSASSIY